MGYEIMPHTADVRLRAWGKTREELFRDAMRGMFEVMQPHLARKDAKPDAKGRERRHIRIEAGDREALLVDFLSEALYLGDIHREAYDDVLFIELTEKELTGELIGTKRDSVEVQVKAVTHHGLRIEERDGEYRATLVFDI